LNRKVKDLAKISALSHKAIDQAILVLEDIDLKAPKTSTIATIISQLNLDNKKTLVILPEYDENIYLSTRNIPNVASTLLADINTYDIMNADILVITEGAAKIFNEEEAVVA